MSLDLGWVTSSTPRRIDWLPWQKKFAWKPIVMSHSKKKVWLRFYYVRHGRYINPKGYSLGPLTQTGNLFDVLRSSTQ